MTREILNLSPQDDLNRFETLTRALIDASSMIYADRAGFLDILASTIELYSIREAMAESRLLSKPIEALSFNSASSSTDQKLISCAIDLNLALISEDKKILKTMQGAGRPFFNSLMMLNFLLYRRQVIKQQYDRYHMELKKFARYSEDVWKYGARVKAAVNRSSRGVYGR